MKEVAFNTIQLNNVFYNKEALNEFCKTKLKVKKLANWERQIFTFIEEWISDSQYVSVQTSGSTGKPKPIKLAKSILVKSALLTAKTLNLKENHIALLCLSAKYIAGKMMIVRAFVNNLNLIYVEPSVNPLKDVDLHIDFTAMVPLQVSNSLKNLSELIKLKAIRKLIIGGGKIDSGLMDQMKSFSNEIYATYGMTETATHIALKKINENYADNHYECLNGITITTDENQCLVIKASHISKEEIRTNDLVKIYSPKQFEILGRKDNVINSGGLKIIPEEVESKIASFVPYNIMISSLSDKELGEKIILLVESKEKNRKKLYVFWKNIEDSLDKYEIPKKIEFLDSFIYTENGEINRKETRSLVKEIE